MTLEREIEAVARGIGKDLSGIGAEFGVLFRKFWQVLLPVGAIAGTYVWIALRTSAGWTGSAELVGIALLIAASVGFALRIPFGPQLRRRARRRRLAADWEAAMKTIGLPQAKLERAQFVSVGDRLIVRVGGGIATDDLGAKVRQLEATLGERLRIERDRRDPSRAIVTIFRRDPLADAVGDRWPGLAETNSSLWMPLPFARDEYGEAVDLSLVGRHLLVGGLTGGGKSVALSAICAAGALDPDIHMYLLDAKRLELAVWKRAADAFVGPDLDAATDLLRRIRAELNQRTDHLESLSEQTGVPIRMITPELGLPLYLLVIDELAEYTDRGRDSAEFSGLLRSLVSLGRAVGVIVVAATQKPQASVVPSELRDLFPYRLAFRCGTPAMSETILGQGWASRGADASRLPEQPGLGLLLADEAQPRQVQTYQLADEDLAVLARRARELRGVANPVERSIT